MSTVTLHIGAFKTGTSFIQHVLKAHKSTLAQAGVLWPGDAWGQQVQAVRGLHGRTGAERQAWDVIVEEIDQWTGPAALMSMEFLSLASPDAAASAVQSLSKHRVRILLTVRDLARAVPAQWQESVQNSKSWSYEDYVAGVTGRAAKFNKAGRHFWKKQDWPKILQAWAPIVPAEDLIVVTVPPAGGDSGLLWRRFCEGAGLVADQFDASVRVNESLGATSAELMRYVTRLAEASDVDAATQKVLKKSLAKQVLSAHRRDEPTLLLPTQQHQWALSKTKQLVDDIRKLSPTVVGDLDDLTPRFGPTTGSTTTNPASASSDDLMDAAAYGLVGLAEELARIKGRRSR